MPQIEVVPAALTATAAPLLSIADGLRELADHRWPLQRLLDSAPTPEVRDALDDLLGAWTPVVLLLSNDARELSDALRYAADYYRDLEDALERGADFRRASP